MKSIICFQKTQMIKYSTQVPNNLFDKYLPNLTESELKILLVIIRQTNGWIDKITGERKRRDRITQSQFVSKAGISPRIVSKSLKMLSKKSLILISDRNFNLLENPLDRRGKSYLYFGLNPMHFGTLSNAQSDIKPVHKVIYNKTKRKEIKTKQRQKSNLSISDLSIGEIINDSDYFARLNSGFKF